MRSIEITITPEGKIVADALGFHGEACEEATRAILTGLGTVTNTEDKPELYKAVRCSEEVCG